MSQKSQASEVIEEWMRLYNTSRGEVEALKLALARESIAHEETGKMLRKAEAQAQMHYNAYVGAEGQRTASFERERVTQQHSEQALRGTKHCNDALAKERHEGSVRMLAREKVIEAVVAYLEDDDRDTETASVLIDRLKGCIR